MKRLALFIAVPLLITSCSDVKKTLGADRAAPDEFSVTQGAPLTVPPNFDLMPPQPGAPAPQQAPSSLTAQGLILGTQSAVPATPSDSSIAEQQILSNAGAAEKGIRQKVDADPEETVVDGKNASVSEKLGMTSNENGNAIDPVEESKRLQKQGTSTVVLPAKNAK